MNTMIRTRSCDACGQAIIDADETLCRKHQPRTKARIIRDIEEQRSIIDRAYWTFCRTAQGVPPSMVCPEAFARKIQLEEELEAFKRR